MSEAVIVGGKTLRIGKVVCLARNYAEHARELGNETPENPVLFIKPATSVIADGGTVVIPSYSSECHYEAELAVLIGASAKDVSEERAMEYVAGYGVGIDFTLRDVQGELKKKGLPWEIAKGFDTSCPLSMFVPAEEVSDPHDLRLRLTVNGETRQDGSTGMMIHRIPRIIGHISRIFTLEAGDVILTGTPSGVGAVQPGDTVDAEVVGFGRVRVQMTKNP